MPTPILDTGTPGTPPPPPDPGTTDSGTPPPPDGDGGGGDPGTPGQPRRHHTQPKKTRQNIAAWKPEDRPAAYKPAEHAHPTAQLAKLAGQHGGVVATPEHAHRSAGPTWAADKPTSISRIGDGAQPSVQRSPDRLKDRTLQIRPAHGQAGADGKPKRQRLFAGGETFAPPDRVLSKGVHLAGLNVIDVKRLSRRKLIQMISNPGRLRSEIRSAEFQIHLIESAAEAMKVPVPSTVLLLKTELAKREAALKLTEGPLKLQTEQALKGKGTFFLDVINRVHLTGPKLEDVRIVKRSDTKKKGHLEVIDTIDGVEVAISTKSTRQAKTAVRVTVKKPEVDVVVGAKINWLAPRTHNKSRKEPEVSESEPTA